RRYGPPLANGCSSYERWITHGEPIVGAPAEYGVCDLSSPGGAALDMCCARARSSVGLSPVLAIGAQGGERRRIARIERWLLRWEEAHQRCVCGSDDGCPA